MLILVISFVCRICVIDRKMESIFFECRPFSLVGNPSPLLKELHCFGEWCVGLMDDLCISLCYLMGFIFKNASETAMC